MHIGLKPCSSCLRSRQRVKDILNVMSKRWNGPTLLVECLHADLVIDNATKKVTACSGEHCDGLLGLEVYLAGSRVYDLAKATPLNRIGSIVKITNVA